MSEESETTRLHSSPVTMARKRMRYAAAIVGLMMLAALASHSGAGGGAGGFSAMTTMTTTTSQVLEEGKNTAEQLSAEEIAAKRTDELKKLRLPVVAGDAEPFTAKIVTCPGCRLNSLPSVKKFVHEYAKHFGEALKVDFQIGEDPVLHLFKGEDEVEEIPLETYSWDKIVKLLVERGITPETKNAEIDEVVTKMIEQANK